MAKAMTSYARQRLAQARRAKSENPSFDIEAREGFARRAAELAIKVAEDLKAQPRVIDDVLIVDGVEFLLSPRFDEPRATVWAFGIEWIAFGADEDANSNTIAGACRALIAKVGKEALR